MKTATRRKTAPKAPTTRLAKPFPGFPENLMIDGRAPRWARLTRLYRAPKTDRKAVTGKLAKLRWHAMDEAIRDTKILVKVVPPEAQSGLKRLAQRHSLYMAVERHAAQMYRALDRDRPKAAGVAEAKLARLVEQWNKLAKVDQEIFEAVIPVEARRPLRDLVVGVGAHDVGVTIYRQRQIEDIGKLPLTTAALDFEMGAPAIEEVRALPILDGKKLKTRNVADDDVMQAIRQRRWYSEMPSAAVEIIEMSCRTDLQLSIEAAALRLEEAKAAGDREGMLIHTGQLRAMIDIWNQESKQSAFFPRMPTFDVAFHRAYRARVAQPDKPAFPGHKVLVLDPADGDGPMVVVGNWRDLPTMAQVIGERAKQALHNDLGRIAAEWKKKNPHGERIAPVMVDPKPPQAQPQRTNDASRDVSASRVDPFARPAFDAFAAPAKATANPQDPFGPKWGSQPKDDILDSLFGDNDK
ncbi:hypothetical protein [Roseomonas genomospecies 6]|nr:hypothetical protein [Roseomonas genomospecies 6]